MFEEMTQENIMERMLSRVDDKLDKREGSIIWDALAPAAAEISEQYAYMDMMLDELFPDTASYYYLVKHCAAIGITPLPATCAVVKITVNDGAEVGEGDRFQSEVDDLIYEVTADDTGEDNVYYAKCTTEGVQGNITGQVYALDSAGCTEAEITSIDTFGSEEEDEDSLRTRYFNKAFIKPFGGNPYDYLNRVLDIEGVGAVRAIKNTMDKTTADFVVPKKDSDVYNIIKTVEENISSDAVTTAAGSSEDASVFLDWFKSFVISLAHREIVPASTLDIYFLDSNFCIPDNNLYAKVQNELEDITVLSQSVSLHKAAQQNIYVRIEAMNTEKLDAEVADILQLIEQYFVGLGQEWIDDPLCDKKQTYIKSAFLYALLYNSGYYDVDRIKISSDGDTWVDDIALARIAVAHCSGVSVALYEGV